MKNRHPIDELADVREQIKTLKNREAELKASIVDTSNFDGDENFGTLTASERKSLDRDKLEKAFGKANVDRCQKVTPVETLKIFRKSKNKTATQAVRSGSLFD